MSNRNRSYAYLTAELAFDPDEPAITRPFMPARILVGQPTWHPADRLTPFCLADDDGIVYFHGYLHEDDTDDVDIWELIFEWSQANYGTTIIAEGHQFTDWGPTGDRYPEASDLRDQVIS